jgi:hypothetical protein
MEGLRVAVLKSTTVDVKERKEWIDCHGPKYDVIISHPKLVETGLTLFSKKPGGPNLTTLVFYETGYHTFTVRQAARRAWRIGQPHDCKVYYLYYRGGMQHQAMSLIAKKVAASTALEGEFSTEGLAALAGEDNAQMALARSLSERIDDTDMQRAFGSKVSVKHARSAEQKAEDALARMGQKLLELEAATGENPLADFQPELQLVGEAILENEPAGDELPFTSESLAILFANMLKAGLSLDDLDGELN